MLSECAGIRWPLWSGVLVASNLNSSAVIHVERLGRLAASSYLAEAYASKGLALLQGRAATIAKID